MPVIKLEQNVTELLNNAVRQHQRIRDANMEFLQRPIEFWLAQEYDDVVSTSQKKRSGTPNMLWQLMIWMENQIIKLSLDNRVVPVSRACALFNSNYWVRATWLLLASLATVVCIYEAPKGNFTLNNQTDVLVFYADIIINSCFLVLSIIRFLSIPMMVRVIKAFGRQVNYLELLFHTGGVFKTPIIVVCLVVGLNRPGMWARMLLLCSLAPSYIEAVPHLSILMNSILGAMGSIFVTVALFFLSLMLYASFGHHLFAGNDPFHFATYGLSFWTFFRLALFDNWADIFHVNFMGCDKYPHNDIVINPAPGYNTTVNTRYGVFHLGVCTQPLAQPYIATFVFISFLFISAYVLVNATMAAVVIGMKSSLDEFKNESMYGQQKPMVAQTEVLENVGSDHKISLDDKTQSTKNREAVEMHDSLRILKAVHRIWAADDLVSMRMSDLRRLYGDWTNPKRVAAEYRLLLHTDCYGYVYIALSVTVALLQVMVDLEALEYKPCLPAFAAFQVLFTLDALARAFTFAYMPPKSKEKKEWWWLWFGLALALLLWIPLIIPDRRLFRSFHLLRLLGMLQYLAWIRDLELIMRSFTASFYGIFLLWVLVVILMFFFSIGGVILFKDSDPYHFSSFPNAFRTLIQILTMDNVGDIMLVNMLGCVHIGYDSGVASYDELCAPDSRGLGWFSPLYFMVFCVCSAFIMMTALIGLIMSAMENLMEVKNSETEIWEDVQEVAVAYEIAQCAIPWLLELFEKLDLDANAHLTIVQLQPLLRAVGIEDEQEQFTVFVKVDRDGSGQIEFPEFCEVVSIIGLLLKKTPLAAKKIAACAKLESPTGGLNAASASSQVLDALTAKEHDGTQPEKVLQKGPIIASSPNRNASFLSVSDAESPGPAGISASVRVRGDSSQAVLASQKSPAVRKALRMLRGRSRLDTIDNVASFVMQRSPGGESVDIGIGNDMALMEMDEDLESDDEDCDEGPVTAFISDVGAFLSGKHSTGSRFTPQSARVQPASANGNGSSGSGNDSSGSGNAVLSNDPASPCPTNEEQGAPSADSFRKGSGHVDARAADNSLRKDLVEHPRASPSVAFKDGAVAEDPS